MQYFIFTFLLLFFFSCGSDQAADQNQSSSPAQPLAEALLGTWEIIDFQVNVPSYLGEDSTVVESVKEADWVKIYGVKPARTTFTPDGKLKRTYYFANGQISDITHGLWKAEGDSLTFIEPGVVYRYFPQLVGEKLRLQGRVDWDKDGEQDDDYSANFRLVGRTLE